MQIQEINNLTQINLNTQQEGTNLSTSSDGVGVRKEQKASEVNTYSQVVRDFQGIAIGFRTIALTLLVWLFGMAILAFAIKNNDPSLLPINLSPGTEIPVPLESTIEKEVIQPERNM
ncbi:hypothetical protein [Halobacillus sp. KGW1]|uniref:hypothetical protein n=1 Tax=Halobacillus sp. KGW1 TaxID=1793726 RepID=UPI000781B769|nr:hypothetical protein [Halobacillus sp. KGW1]